MVNGRNFVIGVDGGGTKTAVVLADMKGKIVNRAVAGRSNVRHLGIKTAAKNVAEGIYGVIKRKRTIKIVSTFIGLPALEEEYKDAKIQIISELKRSKKIARVFEGKVEVGSDQLVAFRSGAHGKDGIVAIAGTGIAIHGWNGDKKTVLNNKGWLLSKGSGNWIGRHAARVIVEAVEDRKPETRLKDAVFAKFKFKDINELLNFVYKDPTGNLPKLAIACDEAADRGDKIARDILVTAGKEIALSVRVAAKKLMFSEKVPLVLVGGVYKSRWVLDTVKKEVSRYYPGRFEIIVVEDPVVGAVRLALESINL